MDFFKRSNTKQAETRTGYIFEGHAVSDVGSVRSNNEDNYVIDTYMNQSSADHSECGLVAPKAGKGGKGGWHLVGIFDGMGGGEKGEVAANETAEIFVETFRHFGRSTSAAVVEQSIRTAFLQANNRIIDLQCEGRVYGTTGTVLATDGRSMKIFHLGDSRAYLLRNGELFQLTRDQTLAQMKLDAGLYGPDDPSVEADKHKLTEYIGRDWTRENLSPVEGQWMPVVPNDRILLCSDGLYDMCTDCQIADILAVGDKGNDTAQKLVKAALDHGGIDNVTCIVVNFR